MSEPIVAAVNSSLNSPIYTSPLAIGFGVIIIGFLILDLGFLGRKNREIKFKESLFWTTFWFSGAMLFALCIWAERGKDDAILFLTGYVVEQSLSVDNLFVFLLVFGSFRVPPKLQHRVLFWGIIGALVLRALCIGLGVSALQKFDWLVYVFGVILIYAGIKTLKEGEGDEDPSKGLIVRMLKTFLPVTNEFHGKQFFVNIGGQRSATPLFLALVTIEISDLIFAVDSIPAVLAVSLDPFIVYTSNIFAIMGLRSIYFALAHMMKIFHYLKYSLSLVLIFVGVKIGISHFYQIPDTVALGAIIGLLALALIASLVFAPTKAVDGKISES